MYSEVWRKIGRVDRYAQWKQVVSMEHFKVILIYLSKFWVNKCGFGIIVVSIFTLYQDEELEIVYISNKWVISIKLIHKNTICVKVESFETLFVRKMWQ